MTGDQQPADLLDLPFDQYQRYKIAGDVLAALERHAVIPPGARLLDVGGYPGLLPRFVQNAAARTVIMDVVPDTSSARHYGYTYVIGSGMQLPFPDRSFDCVVSLDTLEHVRAEARPALLSEMRRVGRHAALFIGPIHREETALAEELLFDYIQWLLGARQEQLAEHRGYGLPDFVAAENAFAAAGWQTLTTTAGNLYNWLFMMVAKHYLISFRDEQAAEFERRLDHFYNLTFSPTDRQEPAYRGVLLATPAAHSQAFAEVAAAYPPVPANDVSNLQRMELTNLLLRLLDLKVANHEDHGLREQLQLRDRNVAALEGRVGLLERDLATTTAHAANLQATLDNARVEREALIADRERISAERARVAAENDRKNEHILYLERLLQGIQAGRAFKLTRTASRLLGRK